MENQETQSFKRLTISPDNLPDLMDRNEARVNLTSYAAQRAKLLVGCYRTGEANDPETYVAAITAVLAHYPEQVITEVTHPKTGLPSKKGWLPNVKEVNDACAEAVEPIRQNELRLRRIREQMEMRERMERGEKPTLEQLHDKYGTDWGIKQDNAKTPDEKSDENRISREREEARVRAEYEHLGISPPSKLALSPTALRDMAVRDTVRNEMLGDGT